MQQGHAYFDRPVQVGRERRTSPSPHAVAGITESSTSGGGAPTGDPANLLYDPLITSIESPPAAAAPTTPQIDLDGVAGAVLDGLTLAEVSAFGHERRVAVGDLLYRAGDEAPDFFVVLSGEAEIVRGEDDDGVVVTRHGAGRFLGELFLLTGQQPYLSARVSKAGRVLAVDQANFRKMMATRPRISDVVFRAFVARREMLRESGAADAIRVVGSRYSAEAMALRAFANRSRLPYTWVDLDDLPDPDAYLGALGLTADDVPSAVTPTAVLKRPTPGEFAASLGLTYRPVPGYMCDLVVVGTGPAGLAASVYGASEGLETVSLDAVAVGGQAAASSRIENYVGFPNGVSGGDLVARASIQALRLGARLNSPCEVVGLRVEDGFHVVELADGSEVPARAVIAASGARYRRLEVDDLERFEGVGVYYAATDLEARACTNEPVVVVGGGNSAGQAAIFLSQQGCRVSLLVRRRQLVETMSQYLIGRIEADPHIDVRLHTEVRGLGGDGHLEQVTVECTEAGEQTTIDCAGVFCFIGAVPSTAWLPECVLRDRAGFVLTDRSLPDPLPESRFGGRAPLPFETSAPGVFAVGDVRSGSMKRVAAAVGEGSSAVRAVHELLALS